MASDVLRDEGEGEDMVMGTVVVMLVCPFFTYFFLGCIISPNRSSIAFPFSLFIKKLEIIHGPANNLHCFLGQMLCKCMIRRERRFAENVHNGSSTRVALRYLTYLPT